MNPAEFKLALRFVWLILSGIALLIVVAPWVLSPTQIAAIVPACQSKARYGRECMLCGMTTAFIAIAQFDGAGAWRANRGAVPLYSVLVLNGLFAILYVSRRRANLRLSAAAC